jgi:hypothetical protein
VLKTKVKFTMSYNYPYHIKFVLFIAFIEACHCTAVVHDYIESGPADHFHKKNHKLVLGAEETSLIVSESARIDANGSILAHVQNGFNWFGLYEPKRVSDWDDHYLHYLTGIINKTVYGTTKVSCINYLILGFDVTTLVKDNNGNCYVERHTVPILRDSSNGSFTLTPNANTAYVIFLSPGRKNSDFNKVVNLSKDSHYEVVDSSGYSVKLYFCPTKVTGSTPEFEYMVVNFPQLKNDPNFDSEVQAIYTVLQNHTLVDAFINGISGISGVLSMGLRYYSFLDTCERCQRFLMYNQPKVKSLFGAAVKSRFGANHPDVPFIAVSHANRIYGNNEYKGFESEKVDPVRIEDYKYSVSGPKMATMLPGYFPQFAGTITPTLNKNRLIALIHEPDLGADDEIGIVRQYFSHLTEFDFAGGGYSDSHAGVLAVKLRRVNPRTLTKVDISANKFGVDEHELFDDEVVSLSKGEEFSEILTTLQKCENLKELNISRNFAGSEALLALKRLLSRLGELRILNFSKVSLPWESSEDLISGLKINTKIEFLSLGDNFIYNIGAEAVASAIRFLPQLKKLYLRNGALCHADGRDRCDDPFVESLKYDAAVFLGLASAIADHPSLEYVDISHFTVQNREKRLRKF